MARMLFNRHVLAKSMPGNALGCMTVKRSADGSYDHYYSLDFVPIWRLRSYLAYKTNFLEHLYSQPKGRVWVESPNHPIKARRPRRRYA